MKKPYLLVPIRECGEKMLAIPEDIFCLETPHIYVSQGAPYNEATPWMLRESVLASLISAQKQLSSIKPGWKIKLADAYRPLSVCKFMFDLAMQKEAMAMGLDFQNLSKEETQMLEEKVLYFWAWPNDNPLTPPPHSTGAAIDCTLADEAGSEIDMGSRVDDTNEKALPNFFLNATDAASKHYHSMRQLLKTVLETNGFTQHPNEWWHFSKGDQLAVWVKNQIALQNGTILKDSKDSFAIYGRVDTPF